MREIKFRAWCPEISEMLCPVSDKAEWTIDDQTGFIAPLIELEKGIWGMIDKYELMQSTGVKDKNGVEIYEKDYVRFGGIVALVTWSDKYCQFRLDDGTATISLNIHRKNDYEVVGNLFENPELLEANHES